MLYICNQLVLPKGTSYTNDQHKDIRPPRSIQYEGLAGKMVRPFFYG